MSKIIENAASKVVVYARVARNEHMGLAAQEAKLLAFAASKGWVNPALIREVAPRISRSAIKALGAADIVVVRAPDRFGRSISNVIEVWSALHAAGTRVVTPDGELFEEQPRLYALLAGAAKSEPRRIVHYDRATRQSLPRGESDQGRGASAGDASLGGDRSARLLASIQAIFAEVERDTHSERVRQGIAAAKARREGRQ